MVTLFFGLDIVFWAAVALTVVFFIDLMTCWWFNARVNPFRKISQKLVRYHGYTRPILIALVVLHIVLHVLSQVFGIVL